MIHTPKERSDLVLQYFVKNLFKFGQNKGLLGQKPQTKINRTLRP